MSYRPLILGAVLALAIGVARLPCHAQTPTTADAQPGPAPAASFVLRGDAVEDRYRTYEQRLERFYETLTQRLREDAVDLLSKLKSTPPGPVPHGYRVLPRLVADAPVPTQRPRAAPKRYSWPWTEQLIERDVQKLAGSEAALAGLPALPPTERRAACEKLAADYLQLRKSQQVIDAHIQYNRLWQRAIADDKAGYDRQTALSDAVLERQAIADALSATDGAAFETALRGVRGVDPGTPRAALEGELRARESALSGQIHAVTDRITPPSYLRVENPSPHLWIVNVPFYTDIQDTEFVRSFKTAVEEAWRLRDGEDEFRVHLSLSRVSANRLYRQRGDCARRGACVPPRRGEWIDVTAHVALFPDGGGILTTGAVSTHVAAGRGIVLGAQDIAPHVLAHELGHVLGFKDEYFRGYRDLGRDGYEIIEVGTDPDDIMGAPAVGAVQRHHFEKLIDSRSRP